MDERIVDEHLVPEVRLRSMTAADADGIASAFEAIGWNKPAEQYLGYVAEAEAGARVVLLAEIEGAFAGYGTLVWSSHYGVFAERGIPEIVDLNVLPHLRRRGIASALMDGLEARAAERSDLVGIGVGLFADYGAGQQMYVRRGYVPDGRGIARDGRTVGAGEQIPIDDAVALMLTRPVR